MMKKRMTVALALLCALCLLVACGKKDEDKPAEIKEAAEEIAEPSEKKAGYDDRLDAAFAAGKVTVSKAEPYLPDPASCEVALPEDSVLTAYGFDRAGAEETVRGALKAKQVKFISYSPDGTVGIAYIPAGEGAVLVAVSENRVTVLYPTDKRGKGELKPYIEQYYMMLNTYRGASLNWLDQYGFIWSPDGRYFCPMSRYMAYMKSNTATMQANTAKTSDETIQNTELEEKVYDAYYVTDTQTGEMFALDAFISPLSDQYGLWMDGCFSEDSQSLYIFYWGKRFSEEHRMETKILRYDLATGEEQALETGLPENAKNYPGMIRQPDSRFFGATMGILPLDLNPLLVRYGGDGTAEQADMKEWQERFRGRAYYVTGSDRTGEALVWMYLEVRQPEMFSGLVQGLIHITPDGDMETEKNTLWALRAETMQLEPMTMDQIETVYESFKDATIDVLQNGENPYTMARVVLMSPEGRYALLLVGANENQLTAVLVRLSDMACLPIVITDEAMKDIDFSAVTQYYANMASWSEAGVLVPLGNGALYQIQ